MFETLTERLESVFSQLRRRGKLTAEDVDLAMRDVRRALLEADVHYSVARDFVARVRERAVGVEVSKALNPAQQVIKIVHDELISTLGEPAPLQLSGPRPHVIMLVGLQGSGKTTSAGKLALRLRNQGERVLLVAADIYRPAAIKQLQTLGEQLNLPVFYQEGKRPPELAAAALEMARKGGYSVMIIDTAGRSQIDMPLMNELRAIMEKTQPREILLVVDAMIGQEALNVANGFREAVPLTGLIFSKMDGDARGGAAISIRAVTGVPIKFLGVGEKMDALEAYDPGRLASRILGMGDVIGLIERAESAFEQQQAEKQARRMMKGEFTLEDFAEQLRAIRRMGPLGQILEMLPGSMGQVARQVDPRDAERQLKITEAIINSMTPEERRRPEILNASRRRRIAAGSGTSVQDVNNLIKQYRQIQKMMKRLTKRGGMDISNLF